MEKKGLLLINTGEGKGKSTAGFGTVIRSLGLGKKCAVVQFIKSPKSTCESTFFESVPNIAFHSMGKGFTWNSKDLEIDKQAAKEALDQAIVYLNDPEYWTVMLDEITYAVNYNFIELQTVLDVLENRTPETNVILTGRDCPQGLIDIADCISEMKKIKHQFDDKIPARKGIDF
ncbi:MAG: cob(I)yrinic acid a,c-diamide adenosyltransferase [Fibrobacterales bacterium]